jgi:uncharacterized protein (UPF0335 family)
MEDAFGLSARGGALSTANHRIWRNCGPPWPGEERGGGAGLSTGTAGGVDSGGTALIGGGREGSTGVRFVTEVVPVARKPTVSTDSVAQDQLRAFIERIERMEEEKRGIADDIKEIYAEAKGNGFDTKVLRQIVRIRKQDHAERMEQEALLELYMAALGMAAAPRDSDEDE